MISSLLGLAALVALGGAPAWAQKEKKPAELSPEQRRILYGDPPSLRGKPRMTDEAEPQADEEDSAAAEGQSLAEPLRELLGRLLPEERREFLERHDGLAEQIGWREESGGRILSPEEESELMERDPAFRARKARERELIERHIRPGRGTPAVPSEEAAEPEPSAAPKATPDPVPAKPSPPSRAELDERRERSRIEAERKLKEMEERDIDLDEE